MVASFVKVQSIRISAQLGSCGRSMRAGSGECCAWQVVTSRGFAGTSLLRLGDGELMLCAARTAILLNTESSFATARSQRRDSDCWPVICTNFVQPLKSKHEAPANRADDSLPVARPFDH